MKVQDEAIQKKDFIIKSGMFVHVQILKHGFGEASVYCDNQADKRG